MIYMWQRSFSTETSEVTRQQVWTVLSDINNWKDWGDDLEWTQLEGPCKLNAKFLLKPKGGPLTKLSITKYDRPNVFADVAYLPLGKMHTTHTLTETSQGIKLQVDVLISGLLSFLWVKVIGQKQVQEGQSQLKALIQKAKSITKS